MSDTFALKTEGENAIVSLIPILDMAIAEELLVSMRQYCDISKNLTLDSAGVERLSTPCIQILLSAAMRVQQNGGTFSVCNVSPGFERGMRDLGLSEYLDNWSAN